MILYYYVSFYFLIPSEFSGKKESFMKTGVKVQVESGKDEYLPIIDIESIIVQTLKETFKVSSVYIVIISALEIGESQFLKMQTSTNRNN